MRINSKLNKGFTLIELLTVIAIIGVLTALFTVSFIGVRQRGRDAQRKSNIKQIQSALELYRADNDSYPTTAAFSALTCGGAFTLGTATYMAQIPCDPSSGGAYYYYQSSATSYVMGSCLENANDKDGKASKPSWWPAVPAYWPPATCASAYYYVTSNP